MSTSVNVAFRTLRRTPTLKSLRFSLLLGDVSRYFPKILDFPTILTRCKSQVRNPVPTNRSFKSIVNRFTGADKLILTSMTIHLPQDLKTSIVSKLNEKALSPHDEVEN